MCSELGGRRGRFIPLPIYLKGQNFLEYCTLPRSWNLIRWTCSPVPGRIIWANIAFKFMLAGNRRP